jgi:hypothetical protein
MKQKMTSELAVVYQSPDSLSPYSNNARTHTKHQIRQIAASIKEFGFSSPLLLDNNNVIVAGHARLEAAKILGLETIPTIRLGTLTSDQIRAYVLADNKLASNAGWDERILAVELQNLIAVDGDLDVTITGFEVPEVDLILEAAKDKPDTDDVFDVSQRIESVTRLGDLWLLGKHRIFCGNSLHESSYKTLMAARQANVIFADPPYNLPVDGNVCGHGSVHYREFVMGAGEMNEAEFTAFLSTTLRLLVRHSTNGSVHFICIDRRHMGELGVVGKQVYESLLNLCVWDKGHGGLGSFYRSRHEMIFVFRNGGRPHRNNIMLGKFGRDRANVWGYASINAFSKQSDEDNLLALHPTLKPVSLVADAILDCSARGELVLDSFLGSGTTLIAAERVGRTCYAIEIDPIYVDVAIRRWQKKTGDRAIHAVTATFFDDVAVSAEMIRG